MTVQVPGLETKSSGLAIFLSFLSPGLGQLYLGRILLGVGMIVVTLILYSFTWVLFEGAVSGQQLHQNIYNITVEGYQREAPGQSSQSARDRAWEELKDLRDDTSRQQLFGLVLGAASVAWWIWGMVLSRKQCERHNLAVYTKATAMSGGGEKR